MNNLYVLIFCVFCIYLFMIICIFTKLIVLFIIVWIPIIIIFKFFNEMISFVYLTSLYKTMIISNWKMSKKQRSDWRQRRCNVRIIYCIICIILFRTRYNEMSTHTSINHKSLHTELLNNEIIYPNLICNDGCSNLLDEGQ